MLLAILLSGALAAAPAREALVDFTEHGQGWLQPKRYAGDGVRFRDGEFVGWIQGDEALVGPVELTVPSWTRGASASFAPSVQGSAWYELAALDARGAVLASTRVLVTQDDGDPSSGPYGYVTIDLDVPKGTKSLSLTNEFVSSSYSHITNVGFGVAEIGLFDH